MLRMNCFCSTGIAQPGNTLVAVRNWKSKTNFIHSSNPPPRKNFSIGIDMFFPDAVAI